MRIEQKVLTAVGLPIAIYLFMCIIHTARMNQLPVCPQCGKLATKFDRLDDPFSSTPPLPTYSHRIPPQDDADPFSMNSHWWHRPRFLILWWPFE